MGLQARGEMFVWKMPQEVAFRCSALSFFKDLKVLEGSPGFCLVV